LVSDIIRHDKSSYELITVKDRAFVSNQLKELIQVATIDFSAGRPFGKPIAPYLQRHCTPKGSPVLFENGGYSMTPSPSTFQAPFTNEPYPKISRDFNPIHINPYFSDLANLPATIIHGMWASAATRIFVEIGITPSALCGYFNTCRLLKCSDLFHSYSVNFVGWSFQATNSASPSGTSA
jgi:fatty acid synthase subunit alpha, fungi type